ncbi:RNA polymerase sigma factor [Parapedobacter tibetensis]|uniref:RNA polymerase sigma factor n=1 Tax=Parapedobacter tibetensis TaxID=2972951 RepID=UPI00214D70CB|nr:sigma-70 family RNA polymerase sigma factor [Parapedobacter tibetensis]
MDLYTEAELAALHERLRANDGKVFDQLFRLLYPALRYYALRYSPQTHMAEEAAMDSLLKAWERRAEFQTIDNLKAFVYTSTRHTCLNQHKMEKRKMDRENRYWLEAADAEQPFDAHIIEAEVLMQLRQAIRTLPTQCSQVMLLSYEEGLSGKEIAERLGIAVSSVNNHKARGIYLLRKFFEQHPDALLLLSVLGVHLL